MSLIIPVLNNKTKVNWHETASFGYSGRKLAMMKTKMNRIMAAMAPMSDEVCVLPPVMR